MGFLPPDSIFWRLGFIEIRISKDLLLGGEESGGMAIKGHIPERDGVWIGLTIWEYMAKSGCTIEELIQEIYDQVGQFSFERIDLHLEESQKKTAMERKQKTFPRRPRPNVGNVGEETGSQKSRHEFHLAFYQQLHPPMAKIR